MNHRWDYGDSDARSALSRRCTACWMTGRRHRLKAGWDTYGRSGVILGGVKVPPCPETPWRKRSYGDGSVSWVLPRAEDEDERLIPLRIITTQAIAQHGRAYIEASLAEQELPPLPPEAWGAVPRKRRHRWQYEKSPKPPLRRHCVECLGTGRKTGYRGAWLTTLPGEEETAGTTNCPGTPWVRRDDGGVRFMLYDGERFTITVTPGLVSQFGREHTEEIVARYGAPPLPEGAWEVLAA
jgi:hypothetical protein